MTLIKCAYPGCAFVVAAADEFCCRCVEAGKHLRGRCIEEVEDKAIAEEKAYMARLEQKAWLRGRQSTPVGQAECDRMRRLRGDKRWSIRKVAIKCGRGEKCVSEHVNGLCGHELIEETP